MILVIATVVGALSSTILSRYIAIETVGTWLSITILLLMSAINIHLLRSNRTAQFAGGKAKLIQAPSAKHPILSWRYQSGCCSV